MMINQPNRIKLIKIDLIFILREECLKEELFKP